MTNGKKLDSETRPHLLVGARLVFRDGTPDILAYPKTAPPMAGCASCSAIGKLRAPKGECFLDLADLLDYRRRAAADRDAAGESGRASNRCWRSWDRTPGWRRPCFTPAKTAAACET